MSDDIPTGVTLKNGSYYWIRRNQWIRLASTTAKSARLYNDARRRFGEPASWPEPGLYRALLQKAKANAKRRGLPFTLTEEHLAKLVAGSRHRCSMTGLRFDLDNRPECSRRPYAPSIDRIKSSAGYVEGNVRIVCFAINVALADWGESVVKKVSAAYLRASKNLKKA